MLADGQRWPARWFAAAAAFVVAGVLTVLVAVEWSPLLRFDRHVSDAAHRQVLTHPALLTTARVVSHVGDPLVVTTLSVLLAAALWLARYRRAAVAVLVVRALAAITSSGLKIALDRPRPHFVVAVSHASGAAFPSGHALGSAALWGTAAVLVCRQLNRWWAVAVAVVVPVLVGVSRVLLGVHWPSDVLAGLCLGWVVAVVATDLLRPARDGPLEWRPLSDRR